MIYLDHAATSPLRPEARAAMEPWWGVPANPSSVHRAGQRAAATLELAREQVAALVGGRPEGVVFTSGATEANHLFIAGAATLAPPDRRRWLTSPIEHPCVLAAVERLASRGFTVERLPVDSSGRCTIPALPAELAGLSLMAANHETGVLQPIAAALAAAHAVGAVLHVDATQAAGKIPLDLGAVDGVVLSSHKLGGPPGIGALILQDGEPFPPLLSGGSQERGRRAGTVPTALAAGFGAACVAALKGMEQRQEDHRSLMLDLEDFLRGIGGEAVSQALGGPEASPEGSSASDAFDGRIPGHTLVVFEGLESESLVQALDIQGLCVSAGAACASGSMEPSPVLTAMGHASPGSAVRISLGWNSTRADVERLKEVLPGVVAGVRLAAEMEG